MTFVIDISRCEIIRILVVKGHSVKGQSSRSPRANCPFSTKQSKIADSAPGLVLPPVKSF